MVHYPINFRVAQKLPLTLLEIHTLAYVFIALLMYLFWPSKPYNALSPVVFTESEVVETAALFTLHDYSEKKEVMSVRCALKDELDTANVMNAHFGSITEERPSMSNEQIVEPVSSPDPRRRGGDILISANERAKKKALTAYTLIPIACQRTRLRLMCIFKLRRMLRSPHQAATISSTSEQTPPSMETYSHDQPQVEYPSQDASAHMHEQRPNEPLTSKV